MNCFSCKGRKIQAISTLDMELFAPNAWLTRFYLAALKVGETLQIKCATNGLRRVKWRVNIDVDLDALRKRREGS